MSGTGVSLPFGGFGLGRKLLQGAPAARGDNIAVAHYTVKAADPEAATQKLLSSFALNGDEFYSTLKKNGVPFQPAVSVGGQQLLTGSVIKEDVIVGRERGVSGNASVYDPRDLNLQPGTAPRTAPASSSGSSGSGLSTGALVAIIVGSVVGGLLLFSLMVYFCCCKGRSPAAENGRRKREQAAAAKAAAAKAAADKAAADVESPRDADQQARSAVLVPSSSATAAAAATAAGNSNGKADSKATRPSLTGYANCHTAIEDTATRDQQRDQQQ